MIAYRCIKCGWDFTEPDVAPSTVAEVLEHWRCIDMRCDGRVERVPSKAGALETLEQTQDIPELSSMPSGVYMVTRHYSYRCDGSVRADPPNHPLTWLPTPERSLRNLPPEWQSQSGSWSSGKYRK